MEAKGAPIRWMFNNGVNAAKKVARGESPSFSENLALSLAKKIVFPKIVAVLGGRLKYAISGAAALSPDVALFIDTIGVKVYEGYGLTETSSAITANTPGHQRIGSVGKPLPGSKVVLDKSVGNDGEQGEIVVYGHAVMMGYHNLPDATKETMTDDGGLRTGDLGRFDRDGFLFITGRVKEIYKLENGKYVAPAPIEEKITLSPFIMQTMVHGANKPHNVALVVPDFSSLEPWAKEQGITGDKAALCKNEKVRELIKDEIEKYLKDPKTNKGFERIQDFLLIPDEFTTANDMLTPTLKMKRRNVMKVYGAALDALYGKPGAVAAAG
jgi:long-chain acyl-CoA synthetase